jgi:hypothetical protein
MTDTARSYFTHQEFISSKALRDAYVKDAGGDASRAILFACIDMAALKSYVRDVEARAVQLGASHEDITASRPVSLDRPGIWRGTRLGTK